jgi:hypothetical protein
MVDRERERELEREKKPEHGKKKLSTPSAAKSSSKYLKVEHDDPLPPRPHVSER